MQILIYSSNSSSRLVYILDELFGSLLGVSYQLSHDYPYFLSQQDRPRLLYLNTPPSDLSIPCIPASNLLFESNIHQQNPKLGTWEGYPTLFATATPEKTLPFDLLSASFFLLSRYEEYLPVQRDQFDRFPAQESIAVKHRFLQQPLINQWVLAFAKWMQSFYPKLLFQLPSYQFLPTYDIDMAWAFLHKGWKRQLGALARSGINRQLKRFLLQIQVQLGFKQDPYYCFSYLDEIHQPYKQKPTFFFLLADHGPYDKNSSIHNSSFQQLIRKLSKQFSFGIHPSMQSNHSIDILKTELSRLQTITGSSVQKSRQHFLKLSFPTTYRNLLQIGISEDYSMGYADAIGFRASIASSFKWFDLEANEATDLKVIPFQVMDVSLRHYLELTPEEASAAIHQLITTCKSVGATFCSLWHNSSFAHFEGWSPWEVVYSQMIEEASS